MVCSVVLVLSLCTNYCNVVAVNIIIYCTLTQKSMTGLWTFHLRPGHCALG